MEQAIKTPWHLWVVGIATLLFNAIGCYSYTMTQTGSLADLGMTPDQIADSLLTLKKEQFNLRFQAATGQVEKTHRVNEIRKDIARLKTILRGQQASASRDP